LTILILILAIAYYIYSNFGGGSGNSTSTNNFLNGTSYQCIKVCQNGLSRAISDEIQGMTVEQALIYISHFTQYGNK